MAKDGEEQSVVWANVRLPKSMLGMIRKHIKDHPEKGYVSIAEFVRHAVAQEMNEVAA